MSRPPTCWPAGFRPASLRGKIVLLGTTAPGLLDLRATPVGEVYPGVETHANLLAGLLDGELQREPDYAVGYELVVLVGSGLLLAFALPLLNAARAVALALAVLGAVVGLNFWLYLGHGLVLPLASALVMMGFAFALNMSYGYLVEGRAKRALAQLFGTYVPPELVNEMVKDPSRYTMHATNRELTVMFCDMRGFTAMAEAHGAHCSCRPCSTTIFSRLTSHPPASAAPSTNTWATASWPSGARRWRRPTTPAWAVRAAFDMVAGRGCAQCRTRRRMACPPSASASG